MKIKLILVLGLIIGSFTSYSQTKDSTNKVFELKSNKKYLPNQFRDYVDWLESHAKNDTVFIKPKEIKLQK